MMRHDRMKRVFSKMRLMGYLRHNYYVVLCIGDVLSFYIESVLIPPNSMGWGFVNITVLCGQ